MRFKIYLNKKIFFILLFLVISENNLYSIENKIILKIDNEIITSFDVINEIKYLTALNPKIENLEKNKKNLIGQNSLVREKIKKNEILKYVAQIKLDKKFLDSLIEDRYSRLNLNSKKQFLEYLKGYQVNIDVIEKKITIEALWNQLIYSKFSPKLKINKEKLRKQINKTYNKKLRSYLLSEIIFTVSNKDDLKVKYEKINQSILNNGFESAALTYSISDSAQMGGKLGWIREDSLNSKIKDELQKLNIDQITKPFFTPSGYLILKIENIELIKKEYNEEKELNNLINFETNQQLNQFSNNYFNKIKKDIVINEL